LRAASGMPLPVPLMELLHTMCQAGAYAAY
jgi:hypothetical protein